jgi:hypothetical protein
MVHVAWADSALLRQSHSVHQHTTAQCCLISNVQIQLQAQQPASSWQTPTASCLGLVE